MDQVVANSLPSSARWLLVSIHGASLHQTRDSADRGNMKTSPALNQFAWLYTRDDESVRLQIHEQGEGFRLVINGPGAAQASHEFDSMSSLMIFVTNYQEQLRGNNFKLQASAERRSEARGPRDGGSERRRS
jgi:hypothetical protein